jgi:hypothetical protein
MDKYLKLSAIEKMAKPMEAFHGKDEYEDENHKGCKCMCCGKPCDACEEADHEGEEGYEEDEEE